MFLSASVRTPKSLNQPFTRPVLDGDNNKLKIDATTAHDIKCGRYIIVCKVFFAKRFPISFKKIDTTTADTFVMINLIILNQSVFLNAVQNAAVANIFWKCAKPTKLGDPTGL